MRKIFVLSLLLCFITSSLFAVDYKKKKKHHHDFNILDNVEIDIDGSSLILTDKESADYVEITEDHQLYVNGDFVKTNDDQEELIGRYYDMYFEIIDYAKRIGLEGAKIGVEGAAIGVKAVAGVFKLLQDDYDSEDLEEELEEEAEKLEEKAIETDEQDKCL